MIERRRAVRAMLDAVQSLQAAQDERERAILDNLLQKAPKAAELHRWRTVDGPRVLRPLRTGARRA